MLDILSWESEGFSCSLKGFHEGLENICLTKILEFLVIINIDLNPAFHSHADPDPAYKNNADPDPASKNNSDPDPRPCYVEGGGGF